jgi:hypothetical protein
MMVLRICVQRFSRLPETIVVDGGAEFGSTYFETLVAAFGCTKKQRPAAKARFGSIIERLFGTTNTEFFHNLRGNTQITKNVRLVTSANNPKKQAVWTLDELYEHFSAYSYEFYDCQEHPALLQSPRQAFTNGLTVSGTRQSQYITYDENFKIFTLPSTPKGTAKVQPSRGVKINYLYYWSTDDSFLRPEIEGTNVPIRYDPFDLGTAYAYVKDHWVRCISEYYKSFHERSEREEPPPSLTQLAIRLGFKSYSSLTTCSKSLSADLTARYAQYQQQIKLSRIRTVLTSALWSDEYPPPSLKKIAQRTGIGLATFYSYCPILCHAISLRYEDYQKFHSKQKIVLGCREVRRLVPELVKLSITPTVKNLRQFMQYPATLWHPEVVEVLRRNPTTNTLFLI